MTRKIGIIGDGHVGSTVAHYIVTNGFADDLVLIDKNEAKVNADAIDFREAMPNLPFHTNITVNDYAALKDADVIISALGNIRLNDGAKEDRFSELAYNSEQVKSVAAKIRDSGFNGIIIAITNPVDVIASLYQQITGLPKKHVIGTGTLLDSARMKRAVAEKLNLDSRSVIGYNLGEHGNSQFTAWSTVRALDKPLTELAKERHLDLDALDNEARHGGYTIFKGKGYTSYGVATAAVRLAKVVLSDAHTVLPVSNYREDYDSYLSYPVVVGRDGVLDDVSLNLTDEEKEKLQNSADFIKTNFKKYSEK
ncbi:L-lactate dehydrogenase [Lactobacillus sanfranciscensis]|uniref:L-2-hydroxyisocaproate dehydrogenase n=1 Tax=Fructilactobacillus sanfranciscensis (strain TMW 1.1304) TaxID=714313 RepID=G2KV26_FRUST|nr:L-lactate dehydrogenase [Fructilactobacillus sanfranciscensis]AEN98915.1 L-2-hydroxyisocaproate dehydrogenase [Fructilactobacillus sanfranciscensis TMW 1.1304]NDR75877.1 L-lactate dehydrogenase [Fructilactobacillus sanfranciscensis]NDR96437.1 L-lactate dehydrogenase [Fructilactobacillus sanfranciscensis]NDS04247.1 L-lactate dehydrogenase [Fructilactobacillus sanfranciscensis]POH18173.1 L-lactate dehydrogenase [Fructilactobacillus sanfranciscensis]